MSCSDNDPNCHEVIQRLQAYLDGELDNAELARIREHVHQCAPCLAELDADRLLKELLRRSCPCESTPDALRAKIIVQITEACQDTQTCQNTEG